MCSSALTPKFSHGPFDIDKLMSAKAKLKDREDLYELSGLETRIKILQLSHNKKGSSRRAIVRSAYRNSWVINICCLYCAITQHIREAGKEWELPDASDEENMA